MKKLVSTMVLAVALAGCQTTAGQGAAESTAPEAADAGAKTYAAPRLAGTDKPDLNGVWQVLNTANYNIEAHPASSALQMRPGPYGPVPAAEIVALGAVGAVPAGVGIVQGDGKIPYTEDGAELRNILKENYLQYDPEVKCYLPGIPRANYMDKPFQIFQSDKAFFFAYEYAGAVRNVYLEDPGEAPVPSWMGQSYGHWDGDTFVIEVTGLNGDTWLDRAGNHHSDSMKVTERWTRTSDYTMRYEATIEDEVTYTKPWKIAFNLYKRTGEDAQLQQFKCVEFVEEMMYGHLRKNPLPGPALERARREAEERGQDPNSIKPWEGAQ
ncbi:MAG: hypothetical protein R3C52_08385 [Hyphomonadaceae bacterium]